MNAILVISFLVLLVIGVPIAFVICVTSIVYLMATDLAPMVVISQKAVSGVDSFPLLAIPLFIVMGYIMESAGLSKRLIDWTQVFFGRVTGGLGMTVIIASAIFAALTGSGPATVAAIGTITLPAMLENGYPRGAAAGMISASGSLGPIIPPSTVMIIYASTMGVSISQLFMAGVIPGVMIAIMFCLVNYFYAKRIWKLPVAEVRYTGKEIGMLTLKALPTLLLPILILGGIYGGVFTPTEAGAVGTAYSLILGFAYKQLNWSKIKDILAKSMQASAMAGFLIGMSAIFCWIMAAAKIPANIVSTIVPALGGNVALFWVVFLVILLVAGCFLEALSAVIILAPILIPVGLEMGIDPIHLALVFCVTMTVGVITPPFGGVLFTTVSVTKTPFGEVAKGELPYIITMVVAIILIVIFPQIATFLPGLMH